MPYITPPTNSTEIANRRTPNSKTFALPDGKRKIIQKLGDPIHYQDEQGQLQDIDTTLQVNSDGNIFCHTLPYKFDLHSDGVGFTFESRKIGRVECRLHSTGAAPFNKASKLTPIVVGNTVTFTDVRPDLDIKFEVRRGQ